VLKGVPQAQSCLGRDTEFRRLQTENCLFALVHRSSREAVIRNTTGSHAAESEMSCGGGVMNKPGRLRVTSLLNDRRFICYQEPHNQAEGKALPFKNPAIGRNLDDSRGGRRRMAPIPLFMSATARSMTH